ARILILYQVCLPISPTGITLADTTHKITCQPGGTVSLACRLPANKRRTPTLSPWLWIPGSPPAPHRAERDGDPARAAPRNDGAGGWGPVSSTHVLLPIYRTGTLKQRRRGHVGAIRLN